MLRIGVWRLIISWPEYYQPLAFISLENGSDSSSLANISIIQDGVDEALSGCPPSCDIELITCTTTINPMFTILQYSKYIQITCPFSHSIWSTIISQTASQAPRKGSAKIALVEHVSRVQHTQAGSSHHGPPENI